QTSRMFCDVKMPDGEPSMADPRHVLRRTLDHAADMGFSCYLHPEVEFYLFKGGQRDEQGAPVPVDQAGYFDHVPGGVAQDFRREAVSMLEAVGISVEFSHHDAGSGQNEIDLRATDAMSTADNIMTARTGIKDVATLQSLRGSFIPKRLRGPAGLALYTQFSVCGAYANAFYEAGAQYQLSTTARRFIADRLTHSPKIPAVTHQFVTSYNRLGGV